MSVATIAFQLIVYDDDGVTPLLTVSSLPSEDPADASYIVEGGLPSGDGQRIDVLKGTTDIGEYTVSFADAVVNTGTGERVGTGKLVDLAGQYQLLSRRGALRYTTDGGTTWSIFVSGYVTRWTYDDALRITATIGDARRAEERRKLFVDASSLNDDFNRACNLIGGYVRDVAGGPWAAVVTAHEAWTFKVQAVTSGTTPSVQLRFVSGRGDGRAVRDAVERFWYAFSGGTGVPPAFVAWANDEAESYGEPTWLASGTIAGTYPGLRARVETTAGVVVGYFTPYIATTIPYDLERAGLLTPFTYDLLLDPRGIDAAGAALTWSPTVGVSYNVWVYPLPVSDRNPIHQDGHPVDLAAAALDEAGIAYVASSVTSTRAAVGDLLRAMLRIRREMTVGDYLAMLGGRYGFGVRVVTTGSDAGKREFFPARDTLALPAPVATVTLADLRDATDPIFDHDDAMQVNRVTFKQERYQLGAPTADPGSLPLDWLAVRTETITVDPDDTAEQDVYGEHELVYDVPGRDLTTGFVRRFALLWERAQGRAILRRFLRGVPAGRIRLLRSAAAAGARVGDVVTLDVPHAPHGGVRGAQRLLQVVQRTVTVDGPDLSVIDVGPPDSASTLPVPTFTLATTGTADPRHQVRATITNTATLDAAGVTVRVEMATGTSSPSGAGALLLLQTPAMRTAGTAIDAPGQPTGTKVWMRMRSELDGEPAGTWSVWTSYTLASLTAPSALGHTSVDGATELLTWTVGESTYAVQVALRLSTASAFDVLINLPAGSTQYRLQGLTASTAYVAGVMHVGPGPYADTSSRTTVSFTTSSTVPTLAAPTSPSVTTDVASYTYTVTIPDSTPSTWVVEEAIETAIGSNTPGTYGEVDRIGTTAAGTISRDGLAASDGLKRYLRSHREQTGWNNSANTSVVSVLPWS